HDWNRLESLTLSSPASHLQSGKPVIRVKRWEWCAQPMLFAALAFASGIIVVKLTIENAWRPASWLLIATITLFAIGGYWFTRRTVLSFMVALLSFTVLGMLDYELYLSRPSRRIPSEIYNAAAVISGIVINSNLATPRSYQSGGREAMEGRQVL